MGLKTFFVQIFKRYVFNRKWRCLCCGKEIFEGNFCSECEQKLPYNDGAICGHCGRKVIAFEPYCTTCKGLLVALDLCRSCFSYEEPINKLIKRAKYGNQKYILEYFSERLALLYLKNYFNADGLVFIPMTNKAKTKRGYNQSEILARQVSEKIGVPVIDCVAKTKETKRQATLSRQERRKNLLDAFKVTDKKSVKNKVLVLIDDVTTTGSTAEVLAELLKRAGAQKVYLITVASTPPIDKY